MRHAREDLGRRLSALRADFAALGARAADAASALAAKLPPSSALLDELSAAREAFTELRTAMVQEASALDVVLDVERLGTLRDLEPVLSAIAAAEERRMLLGAWKETRDEALVVLDRVMALTHREEKGFAPLAECQARARELHGILAGAGPRNVEQATRTLAATLQPFAEVVALAEGWNVLDDDRCASLQDAIMESFGRPLALAALRGKLGREDDMPAVPEPRGHGRAPADAGYVASPPRPEAVAATPAAAPDATATAAAPAAMPVVPIVSAPVVTGAPAAGPAGGGPGVARVGDSVGEMRLSGDSISVETPEARREREQLLERLARESARWWIAAREGWRQMREGGASFADASRAYLERFPYLLSVPLQESVEHEGGRLAEGYALLLAHIEKQEDGFVREALTRLNPQFTTRQKDQSFPLGEELYLYVVAEGRLYKTYPDFVKEVVVSALPTPGPWVQGRLVDSNAQTQVVTRPPTLGSRQETTRSLTAWKDRVGPHLFTTTAGPLTTRFFAVELADGTLDDPPDVEIKLKENDAATDHAWLIPLPAPGKSEPLVPRKHRTGGTTLEGLGKEFGGLWIGVFNADPDSERNFELSIALRRKPPTVGRPAARPATAASAPTQFFGRTR